MTPDCHAGSPRATGHRWTLSGCVQRLTTPDGMPPWNATEAQSTRAEPVLKFLNQPCRRGLPPRTRTAAGRAARSCSRLPPPVQQRDTATYAHYGPPWAGIDIRTRLHRLIATRIVPIVRIEGLTGGPEERPG